jgi:hypothetical protein
MNIDSVKDAIKWANKFAKDEVTLRTGSQTHKAEEQLRDIKAALHLALLNSGMSDNKARKVVEGWKRTLLWNNERRVTDEIQIVNWVTLSFS